MNEKPMTPKPIVKIGFAAPFSGDQAIVGRPMCHCAELAVAQANAPGDLPVTVQLWSEDDRAEPAQAEQVARRFSADETVVAVVGHKNSGPSAAAAPIYAAAGLAQLSPSSTNPQLSRQGYRTFFRLCAHDAVQGRVAAQFARQRLGVRRVAILHDRTDYGQPLAEVVRATFEAEGAEVVLYAGIREGATDFSSTVKRIEQAAPELVYFALTEIESSLLARQLRAAGVEALLFGTDGSRESQFLPLAGAAAEGVYQTYAGADPASSPAAQPFVTAYEARYGPVPVYGAEVYDATNLVIDALRRATRPDRAGVLAALTTTENFAGITGPLAFEASGDRRNPQVSIWRTEQGQMRLVGLAAELLR